RQTPTTLTNRTGLLAALEQVRTHGYALDDEEQETGVRCAAVALPAAAGVRGAVSVSGPSERFTRSAARRAAEALKDVAAAIALDVGTRPADAPDDADPPTQHTLA